jgi:hypothetical protein
VHGLSDAQWKFKPAADRWSIAEIVEHLALVENVMVQRIFPSIEKAPAPAAERDPKPIDGMILTKVGDRTTKFQAPPFVTPTGRWAPSEALDHYLADRGQTVAFVTTTPDLRHHVVDHPAFGSLDGYQWILAIAGHSVRHTKQILEVKSDPNFPKN